MPVAKIKFTQDLVEGNAGEAMIGDLSVSVLVENSTASEIMRYLFELLDVPSGSALTPGVQQDGDAASWSFTPDARGSYGVRLTTYDRLGVAASDVRVFSVLEESGRLIPAFRCKGSAHNFAGQARGWAEYVDRWFRAVDGLDLAVTGTGALDDVDASNVDGDAVGVVRLTGAAPVLGGIAGGYPGRRLVLIPTNAMTIANEASGSSAVNRIATSTGADVAVVAGNVVLLAYDAGASRWRVLAGGGGGGSTFPSGTAWATDAAALAAGAGTSDLASQTLANNTRVRFEVTAIQWSDAVDANRGVWRFSQTAIVVGGVVTLDANANDDVPEDLVGSGWTHPSLVNPSGTNVAVRVTKHATAASHVVVEVKTLTVSR